MTNLRLSILVAMASNQVIGKNNTLPWHLPPDLKHFKALTMGHAIIMGRKTYESIGRPLLGRLNVIVTRQNNYQVEGAIVVNSIDAAIKVCADCDEINGEGFIIGGAELYKQTLHLCQRIYLTEIQQNFSGDTFFPVFDSDEWVETAREKHLLDTDDKLAYHFVVLDKVIPRSYK